MPTLLIFIALGMVFGSNGILKIEFEDYSMAEKNLLRCPDCHYVLRRIRHQMERSPASCRQIDSSKYPWRAVYRRPYGSFCHYVLKMELLTGLLVGAVLGSTDAASVFSILRSKRLNLKYGTASMLEIESGSNDPCAYMLTIIILSAMSGDLSSGGILYSIFAQLAYGSEPAFSSHSFGGWELRKIHLGEDGFQSIFLVSIALASYALPSPDRRKRLSQHLHYRNYPGNQEIPKKGAC